MTTEGLQPADLEELAAYIDGSLAEPRRQAVERRLVTEPRYYEIFLETVRFQQEEREGGQVTPMPQRKGPGSFWWGVAATAAAALGGLLLLRAGQPPSAVELSSRLDAAAVERLRADWPAAPWERYRRVGPPTLDERQIAFRLGVLSVDLAMAVRSGDDRRTQENLVESMSLVRDSTLDFMTPILEEPLDAFDAPQPGGAVDVGQVDAGALESALDNALDSQELKQAFRCGGWAEVGRLASLAEDSTVLAAWAGTAPPFPDSDLSLEVREQLARIRALIAQNRPLDAEALGQLQGEFEELMPRLARQFYEAESF